MRYRAGMLSVTLAGLVLLVQFAVCLRRPLGFCNSSLEARPLCQNICGAGCIHRFSEVVAESGPIWVLRGQANGIGSGS